MSRGPWKPLAQRARPRPRKGPLTRQAAHWGRATLRQVATAIRCAEAGWSSWDVFEAEAVRCARRAARAGLARLELDGPGGA